MIDVSKHIQNLLFEHDYVIIPSFGGIIASYAHAGIDASHTFLPPSKQLAFNQSLKKNDSLLISEISIEEEISSVEATKFVDSFVEEIIEKIEENGFFILEGIGKFFYDDEENLQFDPTNKLNFLEDSYGLSEIYLKPIDRDLNDMKRPPNPPRPAVRRPPVRRRPEGASRPPKPPVAEKPKKPKGEGSSKLAYILIPVALLLVAATLSFVLKDRNGNRLIASLIPSLATNEVVTLNEKDVSKEEVKKEEVEPEVVPEEIVVEEVEEEVIEEEVVVKPAPTKTISSKSGRYHIIAGAFDSESNANRFQSTLANKGASAKVIETGGMYKVSVASYSNSENAIAEIDDMRMKYGSSAWILKY